MFAHAGRRWADDPGHARAGARGSASAAGTAACAGLPEVMGELPGRPRSPRRSPTPGPGQVRALVTVAGNPVLSTPNSDRLDAALADLEFMVSVDIYLNETTRHADVILPPPSPLAAQPLRRRCCCSSRCATSPTTQPAVLAPEPGQPDEWEILAKLALIARAAGADGRSVDRRRRRSSGQLVAGAVADPTLDGRTVATPTRSSRARSPAAAAARSVCSTSCSGPARSATASAPTRRADARRAARQPARRRLRPARATAARGPAHAVRPGRAGAARAPRPTSPACAASIGRLDGEADGARRAPPPAQQQLVDAQHRGARARAGRGARCRSIPTTPPGSASRPGEPPRSRQRVGSVVAPVEVTDADPPRRRQPAPRLGSRPAGDRASASPPSEPASTATCSPTTQALDPLSGTSVLNGIPVDVVTAACRPAPATRGCVAHTVVPRIIHRVVPLSPHRPGCLGWRFVPAAVRHAERQLTRGGEGVGPRGPEPAMPHRLPARGGDPEWPLSVDRAVTTMV